MTGATNKLAKIQALNIKSLCLKKNNQGSTKVNQASTSKKEQRVKQNKKLPTNVILCDRLHDDWKCINTTVVNVPQNIDCQNKY